MSAFSASRVSWRAPHLAAPSVEEGTFHQGDLVVQSDGRFPGGSSDRYTVVLWMPVGEQGSFGFAVRALVNPRVRSLEAIPLRRVFYS